MKKLLTIAGLFSTLAFCGSAHANTILQTWDLINKSPGALGADYGLRLNQMPAVGVEGASTHMIFDFERAGHGVSLQLVDVGGALELHLTGTAFGALFDNSEADGYGTDFAGTYDIDFVWQNVQQNAGGRGAFNSAIVGARAGRSRRLRCIAGGISCRDRGKFKPSPPCQSQRL